MTKAEYQKRWREKLRVTDPVKFAALAKLRNASARKFARENPERTHVITRQSKLRTKYGTTHERYMELLALQGGACAICKTQDPRANNGPGKSNRYFCIDHCHKTGRIRGLLCFNCNIGIGKFQDSASLMQRAIIYLTLE